MMAAKQAEENNETGNCLYIENNYGSVFELKSKFSPAFFQTGLTNDIWVVFVTMEFAVIYWMKNYDRNQTSVFPFLFVFFFSIALLFHSTKKHLFWARTSAIMLRFFFLNQIPLKYALHFYPKKSMTSWRDTLWNVEMVLASASCCPSSRGPVSSWITTLSSGLVFLMLQKTQGDNGTHASHT